VDEFQSFMPARFPLFVVMSRGISPFVGMGVRDRQFPQAEEKSAASLENNKKGHDDTKSAMPPPETYLFHKVPPHYLVNAI